MAALLSEIAVLCVRVGCDIRLVSCGSKHSSIALLDEPFVPVYKHNLKTTGYMYTLTYTVSSDFSAIRHIPCVV